MVLVSEATPWLSRKSDRQNCSIINSMKPNFCISKLSSNAINKKEINNFKKESSLSKLPSQQRDLVLNVKVISIPVVLLVLAVLVPRGVLSAASPLHKRESISPIINEESSFPVNLDDVEIPRVESQRSKRDVDNNDATIGGFYDADENNIEPTKRSLGGNNRPRRVSMMRLKKAHTNWGYPKRVSMMRLRRQYIPVYANNRVTRGMGNVSMLRLRRAPSYMRLKKMTQMRLKRMTQMRLKKSGVPPFEDSYENDLENVVSENKRDAEDPVPVVMEGGQDDFY